MMRMDLLVNPQVWALSAASLVMVVAVIVLLLYRSRCPYRLPRCMRPAYYNRYKLFKVQSVELEEVFVDKIDSSDLEEVVVDPTNLVQMSYFSSSQYPKYPSESLTNFLSSSYPAFSDSSRSSSDFDDEYPSLDSRRGIKRKRCTYSSDDDSSENYWLLGDRYFLHPRFPVSQEEYVRNLEKKFTGKLPDGEKPEFYFEYGTKDKES